MNGKTDFFEIQALVLQRDTLAPNIFAIVLDYAIRRARDGREAKLDPKIDQKSSHCCHPLVKTNTDLVNDIVVTIEDTKKIKKCWHQWNLRQ